MKPPFMTEFKPGDLVMIVEHRLKNKWGPSNVILEPTGRASIEFKSWSDPIHVKIGTCGMIVDSGESYAGIPLVLIDEHPLYISEVYLELCDPITTSERNSPK